MINHKGEKKDKPTPLQSLKVPGPKNGDAQVPCRLPLHHMGYYHWVRQLTVFPTRQLAKQVVPYNYPYKIFV
jgi:hypothetical protein